MAAGCFRAIFGPVGAALRFLWKTLLAVGGIAIVLFSVIIPLSILYGGGMLAMPLAYSTPVMYAQLDEAVTRTNAVLQPIVDDLRSFLQCTWDPKTDFHNDMARAVFGTFRAILAVLNDIDVQGLPSWFEWADRGVLAARSVIRAARVRDEADRREAILRNSTIGGWDSVRAMYAPAPAERSIDSDLLNAVCAVSDGIFPFVGDVVGIYATYLIDFVRILGKFYDPNTGFDVDYINVYVRYILYVIAHEIDFIACIVNIDGLDILDPTTYFFDPYSILACICPEYDDRDEVPSNIPLAVVGCFCGLHGKSNIPDVILECIPWLKQAIADVNWLIGRIEYFTDVTLAGLETAYAGLKTGVDETIADAQAILGEITNFLNGLRQQGLSPAGLANITIVFHNSTRPPPPPYVPPAHTPPPRVAAPQFRAGFDRKAEHRRARIAARREELRAQLGVDLAPLLNGTLFVDFPAAIARRHGPEIGGRAAAMHRGVGSFLVGLYEVWGMRSIHHVFARMSAPEIRAGMAAAIDVIEAERAVNSDLGRFGARGVRQARVAVRSFMPPEAMAPLIVELRALGEHAAAEDAARWAGALNSRAWSNNLVRRGAAADKQRRADAERAAAALEMAAADAARANSVIVHVGGIGGAFILSIFSQLLSVPASAVVGVGASVVAWLGGLIVTAFPIVLSVLAQWAVAFFKVLSGDPGGPQNDLVTPLTNVFYPLIANGMSAGYTPSALQFAFAATISIMERQLLWIASDVLRAPLSIIAHVEPMDLDPDGVPDGDVLKWLTEKALNTKADFPCLSKDDCDGYGCWLNSDPHIKCEVGNPISRGICYGVNVRCISTADCDPGVKCMTPTDNYVTECTPSDLSCQANFGLCAYPCFTDPDCAPFGASAACLDRDTHAFDCTDDEPCAACHCIAWPLQAYTVIPNPQLKSLGVPNCAAIGIDLSDMDYWNLPAAKQYGVAPRAIFTYDFLRFHARCFRVAFQAARVLLGWIINGWNVRRTTIYTNLMSHAFVVLPTAPFAWASRVALGGDLISGLVGGQSGMQDFGEKLQAWPWPIYYAGDFCVFVATYVPTGDEMECIGSSLGPIMWSAGGTVLLTIVVGGILVIGAGTALLLLLWVLFITPLRVFFAFSRVWYAGTVLARNHALPSSGTVVYSGSPDAVGVVHHRSKLHRAHPIRHRHASDIAAIPGIHVRPAQKVHARKPWGEAVGEGLDIALRSTRHIAARRGRIGQYEWADVMHDEHGPIGKRLVMISRK